jgi:hypothetical protein
VSHGTTCVAFTRLADAGNPFSTPFIDEFTQSAMKDRMRALRSPQAKAVCIRAWLEPTIAGRTLWSDGAVDRDVQLVALKWLAEILHRVRGAHAFTEGSSIYRSTALFMGTQPRMIAAEEVFSAALERRD